MTGPEQLVSDFLRSWMPWVTVGGLLWKAYAGAKTNVTEWANKLLDNHAEHAQASLARIEQQGDEHTVLLTKIANSLEK